VEKIQVVDTRYRAVLWDFGGVLTTSPFEAFNRYEAERGLPRDFIRKVNAVNADRNAWAQFESSAINAEQFDTAFENETRAAGHAIPGRIVIGLLSGNIRPRMVSVLKECKRHYKVACLTNNVKGGHGPGMASDAARAAQVAAVMQLFDLVVESSREGVRKPDPRFYVLACQRLGIEPTQAVFLDDLGVNLKSARELGMATIKMVSEQQAIEELSETLGMALL
jgi:putative hydrolase of the HAD superfamily